MKKLIFCFIASSMILVFVIACSKENPGDTEKYQLQVQPNSFIFMRGANSDTLVISNGGSGELSWEITDKPDWIEASKSSGKLTIGNDTVILTSNVNQEFGQYSDTISITSNGGNKEVSISMNISAYIKMKSMLMARMGHSSCVLDGKIYAIGGSTGNLLGPASKKMEVYDPLLDTWTTKSAMHTGRANFSACVMNGKIYAIGGGESFYDSPSETIEMYDPANDLWTSQTDLPRARIGLTVSVVDGKMYIIGGADANDTPIAEVDIYDPATNSWTEGSFMPDARSHLAAGVVNGKIYVIGGTFGLSADYAGLLRVNEYTPATDAWTIKADISIGRRYISACTLNGKIYVFGGTSGNGQNGFSSVEEYDPATDAWTTKADMPTASSGPSAVTLNEKIYVNGGSPKYPPNVVKTMYAYEPGTDTIALL